MHKTLFFAFISSLSLFSMDTPTCDLPKDLIRKDIVLGNDRQTISRFGLTCKDHQAWYRDYMICKNAHDNDCTSALCCFLAQSSRIPMEPLSFYAKKYYEDKSKNVNARDMFFHCK